MKANTNWYWKKLGTKEGVIKANHTIVHPCLYVSAIKDVSDIHTILCYKKRHGRMYINIQFVYLMQIVIIFR